MRIRKQNLIWIALALGISLWKAHEFYDRPSSYSSPNGFETFGVESKTAEELKTALELKRPLRYVTLKGIIVMKLLRDDTYGTPHQKWLARLPSGESILFSHNLVLSQRIPLRPGDEIEVAGELGFSDRDQKPFVHWTHRDPRNQRKAGFVIHKGVRY